MAYRVDGVSEVFEASSVYTQRTQYPLTKEYTLNHIRDPIKI